jgi:pimeloyl-ACP methyl ester carboxylesterase
MESKELVLTNRDGKRMPATLMLPNGAPKGTVLLLHGLGGWKDQPLLLAIARAYVEDGYIVFRFNEADSVLGPDGDFFHSTTTKSLRDVEDVIDHLRNKSGFTEPFILAGHSMGGFFAAWYAAHHPGVVSRLVLIAPAVSWKQMWWTQLPLALYALVRGHSNELGIDGKKFRLSPLWWRDYFMFDGSQYAAKIQIPTLIISAERDGTVAKPFEHRSYAKKFPHAEHSTISWADHDFSGHEDEVIATIRQWHTSS